MPLRVPVALSPRSLEHLERSRYARFGPVVALWRGARGAMPRDLVARLTRHGVQARAALLRNPAGTGRLVYQHVGSGYSFIGDACLPLLLIGRDIEMLPDRDYGDFAARSYYDRVLLPWRAVDGTRFVLGLSEVRRRMLAA